MLAYKYLHPDRIEVIRDCVIRFTQASALNDPFETQPSFRLLEQSFNRRAENNLLRLSHQLNDLDYIKVSLRIRQSVKNRMAKLKRELSTEYLILSLTKNPNNLLMWAHYAGAHHGFVVGFDAHHDFFHQVKPRLMTDLREVKYSELMPAVPSLEDVLNDVNEETMNMIFLTKSAHWSYEEELRMFAQPRAANQITRVEGGEDIYLYKFPAECLREIIFGFQMKQPLRDKLVEFVRNQYPQVKVFEARLSDTRYDLEIVPYQLS